MSHQQCGRAGGRQRGGDRLPRFEPQCRVQRGKRLIEQHELRGGRERSRQRDALLLAARQFVRRPCLIGRGKTDALQERFCSGAVRGDRGAAVRMTHSRRPSNAETTSPPARRNLPAAALEVRERSCWTPPAPRSRSTRNSARSKPPSNLKSVVLPLPDTPRIATGEPDGTKRSTPRRIGVPPKLLVNAAMRRSAIATAALRTRPRLRDWPGATCTEARARA